MHTLLVLKPICFIYSPVLEFFCCMETGAAVKSVSVNDCSSALGKFCVLVGACYGIMSPRVKPYHHKAGPDAAV